MDWHWIFIKSSAPMKGIMWLSMCCLRIGGGVEVGEKGWRDGSPSILTIANSASSLHRGFHASLASSHKPSLPYQVNFFLGTHFIYFFYQSHLQYVFTERKNMVCIKVGSNASVHLLQVTNKNKVTILSSRLSLAVRNMEKSKSS